MIEGLGARLGCYTVAAVCIYSYAEGSIHFVLMSLYHNYIVQAVAAIHCSCCTYIQLHSGDNSFHESIVQAVAAIQISLLQ